MFQYEAAQLTSQENESERDIKEIINYRKALKVTLSDIEKMHSFLLSSVRDSAKDRGNFKST